mmetsp:Transcript_58279/g.112464  ORF Transcript_58279/g.112464 Transcript_58279/m.112464 type:complete len:344 (-) Transcript_58279:51-1082(-)
MAASATRGQPCRQLGRSVKHVRPPCLGFPSLPIPVLLVCCCFGHMHPVEAVASGFVHQDFRPEDASWPHGSLVRRHDAVPQQLHRGRVFPMPQHQRGLVPKENLMVPLADAVPQGRFVATIAPAGFLEVERQPILLGTTNLTAPSSAAVSGSALASLQTEVKDTTAAATAAVSTSVVPAPSVTVAASAPATTPNAATATPPAAAAATPTSAAAATTAASTSAAPSGASNAAIAGASAAGVTTSTVASAGNTTAGNTTASTTAAVSGTDSRNNWQRVLKSVGIGAAITAGFLIIVYVVWKVCIGNKQQDDGQDPRPPNSKRPNFTGPYQKDNNKKPKDDDSVAL